MWRSLARSLALVAGIAPFAFLYWTAVVAVSGTADRERASAPPPDPLARGAPLALEPMPPAAAALPAPARTSPASARESPPHCPVSSTPRARVDHLHWKLEQQPADALTKWEIVRGMAELQPELCACSREHQHGGVVDLDVVIGADGSMRSARVRPGPLSGTPLARCVEDAVLAARFRPAESEQAFSYAFRLVGRAEAR